MAYGHNTVCYKELLGVDIHPRTWISTPERGYPPQNVDIYHTTWISMLGRGSVDKLRAKNKIYEA